MRHKDKPMIRWQWFMFDGTLFSQSFSIYNPYSVLTTDAADWVDMEYAE